MMEGAPGARPSIHYAVKEGRGLAKVIFYSTKEGGDPDAALPKGFHFFGMSRAASQDIGSRKGDGSWRLHPGLPQFDVPTSVHESWLLPDRYLPALRHFSGSPCRCRKCHEVGAALNAFAMSMRAPPRPGGVQQYLPGLQNRS